MISKELIEKAKKCNSKNEILELAKLENVEISETDANLLFAQFDYSKELSEEELEKVCGGCGDDYDYTLMYCINCDWTVKWPGNHENLDNGYYGPCGGCGKSHIYPKYYVDGYGECHWYKKY